MSILVLLDNTVLTNFALIKQPNLVLELWPGVCTTPAVQTEYQVGVASLQLPIDTWKSLTIVSLTPEEIAFAQRLSKRLGAGESSCIAVARQRSGLFVSDDSDARRQARDYGIPTSGSIAILLLNIRQRQISLQDGNDLLARLIEFGYRSPVSRLDGFIEQK